MSVTSSPRIRRLPRILRGVRGRMILLLLVAGIPVIGIAGTNAVLTYESALSAGIRDVSLLRAAVIARHAQALETLQQVMVGLAQDPAVIAAPENACTGPLAGMRRIFQQQFANFWLLDAEGNVACSVIPWTGTQRFAHTPYFKAAVTQGSFVLGAFTIGSVSRQAVLTAGVPIMKDGKLAGVLGGSLRLDMFLRSSADEARSRYEIWLIDRFGARLALTDAPASSLPAPGTLPVRSDERGDIAVEGNSIGGQPFAYAESGLADDLRLLVGLPTSEVQEQARIALLHRMLELAGFLAACLAAIGLGADLAVARPLRQLADRVRAWRPGTPFVQRYTIGEPDEVLALEDALTQASTAIASREAELGATLRQRDLLMAEIHHRVKNNLQIVASLLNMHARRLRDHRAQAEFATARDRVQALATLHRHLYMNRDFETIELAPFMEELTRQLFESIGESRSGRIRFEIEAEPLEIVTDQAVSLALLVTEVVTNALKHAFPDGRRGVVHISVERQGEDVLLTVRDNGVGTIVTEVDLEESQEEPGIGMTLIRGFAQHLNGEFSIQHLPEGTVFELRFRPQRRQHEDESTGNSSPQS